MHKRCSGAAPSSILVLQRMNAFGSCAIHSVLHGSTEKITVLLHVFITVRTSIALIYFVLVFVFLQNHIQNTEKFLFKFILFSAVLCVYLYMCRCVCKGAHKHIVMLRPEVSVTVFLNYSPSYCFEIRCFFLCEM